MEILIVMEKSKVADVMLDRRKHVEGIPVVRETTFRGLPLKVEIDRGMTASGIDPDGVPWKVTYENPYGSIVGSVGRDGDEVDFYLGDNIDSDLVCIIHQVHKDGSYDEQKICLGFDSMLDALECFFKHGARWAFGSMESMLFPTFVNGYLTATRAIAEKRIPAVHFVAGE